MKNSKHSKSRRLIFVSFLILAVQSMFFLTVIKPTFKGEACFREAYSLTQSSSDSDTLELIRRCANYDSKNYRHQALSASFLYAKQMHEESLVYVERMLEIEQGSFEGFRLAALNYEALSQDPMALKYRMMIWESDPYMVDNNYMIIKLLASERNSKLSSKILDKMKLVAPESEYTLEAAQILDTYETKNP